MTSEVLVAGIGNIFLGDDGFGSAVVARLVAPGEPALPPDVRVVDYGIRGLHLLYDLVDGCSALVLVDALPGRGRPGQTVVLEVRPSDLESLSETAGGGFDPHSMNPVAVLAGLPALGGVLPPSYVVGAAPEDLEDGIGLSSTMTAAVAEAADTVRELLSTRPWESGRESISATGLGRVG